jgi:hypothetical protein
MSGILDSHRKEGDESAFGAKTLHVRGFPFVNTAAKFWSCLFDEVASECPPQTIIEMSALTGGQLTPELLTPEAMLQKDMERLESTDIQDAFNDALAALEIIGPPQAVCLRLLPPSGLGPIREMILDYLDADVLPFLFAWLMEWATVPDSLWNAPCVRGQIQAEDHDRGWHYRVAFELRTTHLSEGLFQRSIVVSFDRESAS